MADKVKGLLLGCGGISDSWLNSLSGNEDVEVVALVDLRPEAAEAKATKHGLTEAVVATDLEEAIRQTRPDVVFNLTTPEAHCPTALLALEHGCHVLTEKPLAHSMGSARKMQAAAKEAGRLLAVAQNRRYVPQVRALKEFVASGGLGRLTTVQSNFFIGAHFTGFRLHMAHVLLLDMAIHTFDAARCMTGADARAVYCHEWNPEGSWYDRDAAAVAIFEMTDDIVYTYQGSWCAEGGRTSWEAEWRIIGTEGTVLWDGADQLHAEVVAERGERSPEMKELEIPVPDPDRKGRDAVIDEFIECMRTGQVPETHAADNIRSLAMVFGAIESAEAGRKVEIRP